MSNRRRVHATGPSGVDWWRFDAPVAYAEALDAMTAKVEAIRDRGASEEVWLLEHPPLITAGTSAKISDLVEPERFPVFDAGRGGQYTYHGPGQRIAYCMLDLVARGRDLRAFVANLEGWLIASLDELGIKGERREGRVGIWVSDEKGREAKIGALGVRVRRWVTLHGVSLNVAPDLTHFDAIVPCGIREHGVTSIAEQGLDISMREVDEVLIRHFERTFRRSPKDCDAPLSEMARQA